MTFRRVLASKWEALFNWTSRFWFKYDIFISYRRKAASLYAIRLNEQLSALGLTCFLDQQDLPPGQALTPSLRRSIRRSASMVLVGSDGVLESDYVRQELEEFAKTGRTIIPINFEGSLALAPSGLIKDQDLIWSNEKRDALARATPSPAVLEDIDKAFKFVRRRTRVRVASLGIFGTVLLIVATLTVVAEIRRRDIQRAVTELGESLRKLQLAEQQTLKAIADKEEQAAIATSRARASAALAARSNNDPDLAVALALEAAGVARPPSEVRRVLAEVAYAPGTVRRLDGHTDAVLSVAFSPDGRMVLSGSADKTLRLWDARSGQEVRRFTGHADRVTSVGFSPDGRVALSGSSDATMALWNVATGKMVRRFKGHSLGRRPEGTLAGQITSVAFSPDGQKALSASLDNSACYWDIEKESPLRCFKWKSLNGVKSVAFSPRGTMAMAGLAESRLLFWNVETGEIRHDISSGGQFTNVAFSPDGQWALSAQPVRMTLWNLETGKRHEPDFPTSGRVESVAFSPDGRLALSGSEDRTLTLWRVETKEEVQRLRGHTGSVTSVAYSPDGRTAVSGSVDHTVRLWELDSGAIVRRFDGQAPAVFSSDGKSGLSGSPNKTVTLWNLESGAVLRRLQLPTVLSDSGRQSRTMPATSLAFSPDDKSALVGVGSDELLGGRDFMNDRPFYKILRWNVESDREVGYLTGHARTVFSVSVLADGLRSLSGSRDGTVRLWDLRTGQEKPGFNARTANLTSVTVSHGGQTFLSGSRDGSITLRDAQTGHPLRVLQKHGPAVRSLALSPDDRRALSGSDEGQIALWNVETNEQLKVMSGHTGSVTSVAFLPGSESALSASADGRLILWDLGSGEATRVLLGHRKGVDSAAISRDGRRVLSASRDGELILWRIDTWQELVDWARANRFMRPVTEADRLR